MNTATMRRLCAAIVSLALCGVVLPLRGAESADTAAHGTPSIVVSAMLVEQPGEAYLFGDGTSVFGEPVQV